MNIVPKESAVGRRVLYPDHYCWYVLAGSVDIMVTYLILNRFGGWEVNQIAAHLEQHMGLWGLILLKYATVIVVVLICEYIGRRRYRLGRWVAAGAIGLSAMPVGIGLLQIGAWIFGVDAMMGR